MDLKGIIKIEVLPHGKGLTLPEYQTQGSAGFDFRAAVDDDYVLEPGSVAMIPTGLKMAVPSGFELQVRPRSGLAAKNGITVLNSPGTVDSDYRGEIKVILINLGKEPFVINRGMRIAQGVVASVTQWGFETADSLDETERGEGGFGSTGN